MGGIYAAPTRGALPFDFWTQGATQLEAEGRANISSAGRYLQEKMQNGDITRDEYLRAVRDRTGPLWDEAMAEAQKSHEDNDPMDALQVLFSPHAPLAWAYQLARGTPENIGPFLPITRTIKGITGLLGWPGGGLNIEAAIRRQIGLPAFDKWDDYRAERMLINMVADGTIPLTVGQEAFHTHKGEAWTLAVRRARQEHGLTVTSSTIGIPMRAYPEGEENIRSLTAQMMDAYEIGGEAVNAFFDKH